MYAFCHRTSYLLVATKGCAEEDPAHERITSMQPHAEASGDDASRIPEPENKSAKVVHALSSPSTPEPGPKRHKGKQKESHAVILKEFLNSFEDEMICSMSGLDWPLDKRVLTFILLDAVTSCKEKRASTCDPNVMI